jgi:hypothetical protein
VLRRRVAELQGAAEARRGACDAVRHATAARLAHEAGCNAQYKSVVGIIVECCLALIKQVSRILFDAVPQSLSSCFDVGTGDGGGGLVPGIVCL